MHIILLLLLLLLLISGAGAVAEAEANENAGLGASDNLCDGAASRVREEAAEHRKEGGQLDAEIPARGKLARWTPYALWNV